MLRRIQDPYKRLPSFWTPTHLKLVSGTMNRLQDQESSTPPTSKRTNEILAIHEILSLLVPPELANLIMDYTSLMGSVKFVFDASSNPRVMETWEEDPTPYWAARCILLTDKLSIDTSFSEPRSVTFTMRSHDQGWGGHDGAPGTYLWDYRPILTIH